MGKQLRLNVRGETMGQLASVAPNAHFTSAPSTCDIEPAWKRIGGDCALGARNVWRSTRDMETLHSNRTSFRDGNPDKHNNVANERQATALLREAHFEFCLRTASSRRRA